MQRALKLLYKYRLNRISHPRFFSSFSEKVELKREMLELMVNQPNISKIRAKKITADVLVIAGIRIDKKKAYGIHHCLYKKLAIDILSRAILLWQRKIQLLLTAQSVIF